MGQDWFFQCDISVEKDGIAHSISSLSLNVGYDPRHTVFQELVSQIEILFHGFGGGGERASTVSGLFAKQLHITSSLDMFFYAVHDKEASVKSPRKKAAKHKMPPSCVILYMLFRRICILLECGSSSSVVPIISGRTILMKHAICRHFGLDSKVVSALDIRHFYTSITNDVYARCPTLLIADDDGAKANNHSAPVHAKHYPTEIVGAEDARYEEYHRVLGETRHASDCNYQLQLDPISDTQLQRALQSLFGQLAAFTSSEQKDMVRYSFNSRTNHKVYFLQCGGGKTLSILLPIAYEKTTMQFGGCRIFILPYVFLVESLREAFESKLQHFDVTILAYTASSITDSSRPDELNSHDPPDILILTADAAANLVQFHSVLLHTWHTAKLLRGIWIDEVQTIIGEFSLRPCFQQLPKFTTIGPPISLLSGSYAPKMMSSLLHKFNLGNESSVDIVQSPDLIGSGLNLEVIKISDGLDIISVAIELVDKYCQDTGKAAHIMCASKQECMDFESRLENRLNVRVVHSDTSKEKQSESASAWYQRKARILVTTSLGIVGNENEDLGLVLILRLLYSMSNFVQILGRHRPRHRGPQTKVYQLVSNRDLQLSVTNKVRADDARTDLLNAGWLCNEDVPAYDEVFHIQGYVSFLTTGGCSFSKLSRMFSGNDTQPCGNRCTFCREHETHILYKPPTVQLNTNNQGAVVTPARPSIKTRPINPYNNNNKRKNSPTDTSVEQSTRLARAAMQVTVNDKSVAESKLEWLKVYCPRGCIGGCNGETCLNGACYICGSCEHQTGNCNFKWGSDATKSLDEFMKNKGFCVWCLGKMRGDTDMHGPLQNEKVYRIRCPMQKRLRTAINTHFQEKCKLKMAYGAFLRGICASDETYYKFISKLDIDRSAPRQHIR